MEKNITAEPESAPNLKTLEAQLARDEEQFNAMLQEREAWPVAYSAAARNGDATAMMQLNARKDEFEALGPVLKVKKLQAAIAVKDGKLPAARQERDAKAKALSKAEETLKAAQAAHGQALYNFSNADESLRDLQRDIATGKREIENLFAIASKPPAPVVRTLQTQARGHFSEL